MTNNKPNVFLLIDGHNLFHRQIRMTNPALGIDSMIGMALHLILNNVRADSRRLLRIRETTLLWNYHTPLHLPCRSRGVSASLR